MKKHKVVLDEYEQEIEDNFGKEASILTDELRRSFQEAAKRHVQERQSITIRVFKRDLNAIKFKAAKQALPYQTYINTLLHRDAMST